MARPKIQTKYKEIPVPPEQGVAGERVALLDPLDEWGKFIERMDAVFGPCTVTKFGVRKISHAKLED